MRKVGWPVIVIPIWDAVPQGITAGRRILVVAADPSAFCQISVNSGWVGAGRTRVVSTSPGAFFRFADVTSWILALWIEAVTASKGAPLAFIVVGARGVERVLLTLSSKSQRCEQNAHTQHSCRDGK